MDHRDRRQVSTITIAIRNTSTTAAPAEMDTAASTHTHHEIVIVLDRITSVDASRINDE